MPRPCVRWRWRWTVVAVLASLMWAAVLAALALAGALASGRPILRAVVFVGLAAVVLLGALGRRRAGDRASRP